jgi:putative membrane protein
MFGHGGWFGGGGMGVGMWVFWILLIVVVVVLIKALAGRGSDSSAQRRESPLEILKARYARGEISEEEYHRRRDELEK